MKLIPAPVFLFLCGLLFLFSAQAAEPEWKAYRTVIHAHTDVSSGRYNFDELAEMARNHGVDAVFLTDNHWLGFQYGLPGMRHIAWVSKKLPSVLTYGPKQYLNNIAKANREHDDVLLIPGIEVIPRYYWEGSLFKGNLTHWNMQRNLMILGVDDPEFITKLPVAAGYMARRDTFTAFFSRLTLIWLFVALHLTRWIPKARAYWSHGSLRNARGDFFLTIILPSLLLILLINLFQGGETHDIYGRKVGVDAEQRVIDAAAKHKYFSYWAHPEAFDSNQYGPIKIRTNPYPDMLRRTRNYNAFGALYEQGNKLYLAGGEWDLFLADYIRGVRGFPVWALGEMLYHYEGQAGKKLSNVETMIWAKSRTQPALLNALKGGRFYCRRRVGNNALVLKEFSVNQSGISDGWMKNETGVSDIRISLAAEQSLSKPVELTVVKNGEIIHEAQINLPATVELKDKISLAFGPGYYRIYVRGDYPLQLVSNPIFVD